MYVLKNEMLLCTLAAMLVHEATNSGYLHNFPMIRESRDKSNFFTN
jgi:hypothetical protein